MFGVFVSDGLIAVDGQKNVVECVAMGSGEDHQIVEITRLHAVIEDEAFHDKKPLNAEHIKASLETIILGAVFKCAICALGR